MLAGVAALAALAGSAVSCGDAKVYPYVHQSGGKVTCPDMMVGWAAVPGPGVDGGPPQVTTGGGDVPTETVNNVYDLTTKLQSPEPRVIVLDGMLPLTEAIKVTADKDNPNGNKTLDRPLRSVQRQERHDVELRWSGRHHARFAVRDRVVDGVSRSQ